MITKKITFSLFLTVLLFVCGCGGGTESINVFVHCDQDCNENNAVVVKIYQLKNADKFSHASFESLLRNPDETLGDDLIAAGKSEKLMAPNESFSITDYEIKKDAAYIGIVGDFHSPATDGWRQIIPAKDIGDITVRIHSNSLTVQEGD
jgi:type VI secretion system VasD/TssJ family lipoprotein